jgi:hypothetical protein
MKRFVRGVVLAGFVAVALLAAAGSSVQSEEHAYVGSKKCKMCHMKEHKSWSSTKMANSFDNLKPGERADAKRAAGLDPEKDYTTDETCLPCHTTGYGAAGGFKDAANTPDRAGVGCEMCHGAGGTYVKTGNMTLKNKNYKKQDLVAVGLVDQVTEAQCAVCHNSKSPFVGDDYVFDFQTRKDEGTHEKIPLKYEH